MKVRRTSIPRPLAAQAAGFTLLEVLVAIVVLSFGVLGMVGLQAAALQSNKEARYQAAAARLGRELGDLMRGNKDVALQPAGINNPYLFEYPKGAPPTAEKKCTDEPCTSTLDVATFQINDWLTRLTEELPGARVSVCFDTTPYDNSGGSKGRPHWDCTGTGSVAFVKIGWSQRKTDGAGMDLGGDDEARPIIVMPLVAGTT